MARDSRAPAELRRCFQALGNDPSRIAEHLVRSLLLDTLLRRHYTADTGMHEPLRRRAKAELRRGLHAVTGRYNVAD